jgi:hypothetical protein
MAQTDWLDALKAVRAGCLLTGDPDVSGLPV